MLGSGTGSGKDARERHRERQRCSGAAPGAAEVLGSGAGSGRGAREGRRDPAAAGERPEAAARVTGCGPLGRDWGDLLKMAAPGAGVPCGRCAAAAAPYTCPRCNLRLCSLACYRSHGACAEAFYREQVLQALEAERQLPAGRDRDRLAAAFRRLQLSSQAEEPEPPAGRDLWSLLDAAERAEFWRLLRSGEAADLLPPWRPWWWRRRRRSKRLVVELGKEGEEEEEVDEEEGPAAPPPPLPASTPSLRALRSSPVSPLLPFHLPNVLYGYAFALSLHAGDERLLPELPAAAIAVSASLRSQRPFASASQALYAARQDALAAGYPQCPLGDSGTVLAVVELLECRDRGARQPPYRDVTVALGHLEELLRKGKRRLAAEEEEERKRFGSARRKCRFLGAWSREEEARGVLEELGREARRVWEELVALRGPEGDWAGRGRGSEVGEGEAPGGHWEGLELERAGRRSPLGRAKREGKRLVEELE